MVPHKDEEIYEYLSNDHNFKEDAWRINLISVVAHEKSELGASILPRISN